MKIFESYNKLSTGQHQESLDSIKCYFLEETLCNSLWLCKMYTTTHDLVLHESICARYMVPNSPLPIGDL